MKDFFATIKRNYMQRILEQDLPAAMYMLTNQITTVSDLTKYWDVFKTRVTDCPEIERIRGSWMGGLF